MRIDVVGENGCTMFRCDFCGFTCGGIYYFYDVICVGCDREYQTCMGIVSHKMNPESPCKTKMYEDRDLTRPITVIYHKDGTSTGYYRGTRYMECCLSCKRDKKIQEILK